jgi:hypothetical protein
VGLAGLVPSKECPGDSFQASPLPSYGLLAIFGIPDL